jgi:metallo-beta-lactamase class B
MTLLAHFLIGLLSIGVGFQQSPAFEADPATNCTDCAEWNGAREPFKVFGNTYFVGPKGLGAVLIASDNGLILLDGGLPQTATSIDANIRKLGFRTQDIKLIVNSHAHFDHAGGIHALQRASGATVASSAAGARALERGEPTEDDPQYAFPASSKRFPAIKNVKVVKDGETLRVGDLAITAHYTPGHTPGATTWSWRSCEGSRCLNIVYADSVTPVSAPGFRFTGDVTHPSRVEQFRRSLATIDSLPCDIVLSTHPAMTKLDDKLARRAQQAGGPDPLIDPQGCHALAAQGTKMLDARIAEEKGKSEEKK